VLLKIIQFCVAVAVLGSNGAYHWTPNGYVAGLVALFAALLVTAIILESLRLGRWFLRLLKKLQRDEVSGLGAGGERPVHELVGEIGLDRGRHNHPPGECLGNAKQPRIE